MAGADAKAFWTPRTRPVEPANKILPASRREIKVMWMLLRLLKRLWLLVLLRPPIASPNPLWRYRKRRSDRRDVCELHPYSNPVRDPGRLGQADGPSQRLPRESKSRGPWSRAR